MLRIAVLVSGGGTNLQALIDAERRGELAGGKIVRVIASRPGAYALERAEGAGIPGTVVCRKDCASPEEFDRALLAALEECGAELVVLAGYLSILSETVVTRYANRILNIHPALIPSFCGKGFYGLKVHEAALACGVKVTGATVHFVNEIPDGGAILLQKAVEVLNGDTPETLQRRVMEQAEWELLPRAVALFCQGRITIEGRRALIREADEHQRRT
ncbi:MAG: phosphoribosylglycinamide formyltransferase [Clostridiales bacterium]|nr:phosphoribosylglycinamide formyltransferase [Clostridiales bacterium]